MGRMAPPEYKCADVVTMQCIPSEASARLMVTGKDWTAAWTSAADRFRLRDGNLVCGGNGREGHGKQGRTHLESLTLRVWWT